MGKCYVNGEKDSLPQLRDVAKLLPVDGTVGEAGWILGSNFRSTRSGEG